MPTHLQCTLGGSTMQIKEEAFDVNIFFFASSDTSSLAITWTMLVPTGIRPREPAQQRIQGPVHSRIHARHVLPP